MRKSEDGSFLSVRFEKLKVSQTTPQIYSGLSTKSKVVLKSEKEVLKRKKPTKKKPIVQKSKLGESFRKFRETFHDVCSSKSREVKPLVFGRKYSFSLENFNSLSLQEESSELSNNFSSESFKHINGSGGKRKRERSQSCDETGKEIEASGPGCTAMSQWRTWPGTWRTRPSSLRECHTWL